MLIGVALVLLGAGAGLWFALAPESASKRTGVQPTFTVVAVKRHDLRQGTTLPGTLGYGEPAPLPIQMTGIVTWLPKSGSKASLGDVLVRVDDRPVVLMYGRTPAYRTLHAQRPLTQFSGKSKRTPIDTAAAPADEPDRAASVGPDVLQLEQGLWSLGYRGFTVDDHFTTGTAAAVRTWQSDLEVTPTGEVELGDVVFLPGPTRLTADSAALGVTVSPTAVQGQENTRFITVQVTGESDWTRNGTRVRVRLPNGKTTSGTVNRTRSPSGDSPSEGGGGATVRITLDTNAPRSPTGDVQVTYVTAQRRQVLAVPVIALIALAEGGYGVQLEDGDYVPVKPGLYADGLVEINGDATDGTRIRVPE